MRSAGRDGGWDEVARNLEPHRNYWLVTVDASGAPHATPVWGVVHDSAFYSFSTRESHKAQHLARDPRAVVHLEDGDDVVIVHGVMKDLGDPAGSPDVVEAFTRKYDEPGDSAYLPTATPAAAPGAYYRPDVLYRLVPERALMWSMDDFDGSQARWARPAQPAG
ncbi:MAG TPA: pyridoxamine 5'-phosphate oxidase family protein [Acidimicrobiales bacterium]|nr:pyridoxamine 5'-phosphate oxidase family protein [Acidimicrobiales bacterium]